MRTRLPIPALLALLLVSVRLAFAAPPGLCDAVADGVSDGPALAIFSAFPAELAPLVAAATIDGTDVIDGRSYYRGHLDGVRVILGLLGIGLVNAGQRTESLLASRSLVGVLVSGVAGSHYRIGDVVVGATYTEGDAPPRFKPNPLLLGLEFRGRRSSPDAFVHCAEVPPADPTHEVCFPYQPKIIRGGHGVSADPFGGSAVKCSPGAGEVFGCELPSTAALRQTPHAAAPKPPEVEDMETAAVARVAANHDLPFLAMRAVSDGKGDPLGDRGFPGQFFDYYKFAAINAALATRGVTRELHRVATRRDATRFCRLAADQRWRRALGAVRHASVP